MTLHESLNEHPLVLIIGVVIVSVSVSWSVANEILVKPRDFQINTLKTHIETIERKASQFSGVDTNARHEKISPENKKDTSSKNAIKSDDEIIE